MFMNTSSPYATAHIHLTRVSHHAMLQRCYNSNCKHFHLYGGRGLLTDPTWAGAGGFDAFCAYLTSASGPGLRPSIHHSIERKDNDIGYFPGNLKWILKKDQPKNRRSNWSLDGKTAQDTADAAGIPRSRLVARIAAGQPVEVAATRANKNDRLAIWRSGWASPGIVAAVLGVGRIRAHQLMTKGTFSSTANQNCSGAGSPRWWVSAEELLKVASDRAGRPVTGVEVLVILAPEIVGLPDWAKEAWAKAS